MENAQFVGADVKHLPRDLVIILKKENQQTKKTIKAAFSKIYYNRTGTSLRRRVYLFICLYSCYFLTEVNHLMRPLTPDVLLLTDTVVRQCD